MSDILDIKNYQKVIYIYNENSARFNALYKHVRKFHPDITVYSSGMCPIDTTDSICNAKSFVFILNETSIQECGAEFAKFIPLEYLVFPQ